MDITRSDCNEIGGNWNGLKLGVSSTHQQGKGNIYLFISICDNIYTNFPPIMCWPCRWRIMPNGGKEDGINGVDRGTVSLQDVLVTSSFRHDLRLPA